MGIGLPAPGGPRLDAPVDDDVVPNRGMFLLLLGLVLFDYCVLGVDTLVPIDRSLGRDPVVGRFKIISGSDLEVVFSLFIMCFRVFVCNI